MHNALDGIKIGIREKTVPGHENMSGDAYWKRFRSGEIFPHSGIY